MCALPAPPGATPHRGGTTFSLWAPNATAVRVRLATSGRTVDMAPEPGGRWFVDVPGVGAGERYQYVIEAAGSEIGARVDPYAREIDVTDQGRCAVVHDPAAFEWGPDR